MAVPEPSKRGGNELYKLPICVLVPRGAKLLLAERDSDLLAQLALGRRPDHGLFTTELEHPRCDDVPQLRIGSEVNPPPAADQRSFPSKRHGHDQRQADRRGAARSAPAWIGLGGWGLNVDQPRNSDKTVTVE